MNKQDCPIGYVICKNNDGLKLIDRKMTFTEAHNECSIQNSTICKFSHWRFSISSLIGQNLNCFASIGPDINLVSPLNFVEIKEIINEMNITELRYIIWTDFERINMTHFRTSSKKSENFLKIFWKKIWKTFYQIQINWKGSINNWSRKNVLQFCFSSWRRYYY